MSKHTSGPWGIERTKETLWVGQLKLNGKVDAIVTRFNILGLKNEAIEQEKANARLVSAAPELLEALELADCLLSGANMNRSLVERKVRDAIAKAKGEA